MIVRLVAVLAICVTLLLVGSPVTRGAEDLSPGQILDSALEAAGGKAALVGLKSLRAYSVNIRTDLGQGYLPLWEEDLSRAPSESFVTDTYVDFVNNRRYWHRRLNNSNYINAMTPEWAANTTDGNTTAQGTNITDLYTHRNRHMTFPGILITAMGKKSDLKRLPDGTNEGEPQYVLGFSDLGRELRVFVNQKSGLISRVEWDIAHPIKDKVTAAYRYRKWRKVGNVVLPFQTEGVYTQNGTSNWTIEDMTVELNVSEGDRFKVGDQIRKQSLDRISRERSNPPPPAIQSPKLAEGVFHLRGLQNNLVIEMSDHLVVVDTPADGQRTERVLAHLKQLLPDKPIRAVIFSHWHHDHSGGLRGYVASGARVYAGASNRAFIDRFLATPFIFSKDAPQMNPRKAHVRWVKKTETLTDGPRRVEIIPVTNPHADGMLAVFVRDGGVLFISDLFPSDDSKLRAAVAGLVAAHKLEVKTIAPSHGAAQTWDQFQKASATGN